MADFSSVAGELTVVTIVSRKPGPPHRVQL